MVKLVLFCMYGITKPMGWFQGGTPYSWYSIGVRDCNVYIFDVVRDVCLRDDVCLKGSVCDV